VLHFVLMNTSALLVVAGLADDYIQGTKMAMKSITSGAAWKALELFRDAGMQVFSGIQAETSSKSN
jgi:anthranilate phosphoribosyltransferase